MNRVLLQLWEESTYKSGVFTDGCSLHKDKSEHKNFISKIYCTRSDEVPDSYSRPLSLEIDAFVSDLLYDKIKNLGTIKLSEVEFRNSLKFEDIIFNTETI